MEEFEVNFVVNGEKLKKGKANSFFKLIKFETINLELFLCTVIAGLLESYSEKQLSFTLHGILFFLFSISANIMLIEIVFRLMKVIKNGKSRILKIYLE